MNNSEEYNKNIDNNLSQTLFCKFCNRECHSLNSLKQHEIRCKQNPNKIKVEISKETLEAAHNARRGQSSWNKGLTKETSEAIRKQSETLSKNYKNGLYKRSTGVCSDSKQEELRRAKISATMKNHHCGGYRKGSGRGKQGRYNGYWCDSSWELAFVIFNIEHNILFKRCNEFFSYVYNGVTHMYIPDFVLEDGTYIEIKGFETDQSKAKIDQFPKKILLLTEKEMKLYLDYVIEKYGKNFTYLYNINNN